MALLFPLLSRNSKLSKENKLTLVKSILIPTVMYANELYQLAKPNQLYKIQILINKAIRMALKAPWYILNRQLRNETGIKTIEEISTKQTQNTKQKMEKHTNQKHGGKYKSTKYGHSHKHSCKSGMK